MDSGDLVFYIILALSILVPLIGKRKEKLMIPDSLLLQARSQSTMGSPIRRLVALLGRGIEQVFFRGYQTNQSIDRKESGLRRNRRQAASVNIV
jgi:hypothetical protein